MIKTVEWTDEGVRMIDQRILPMEEKYLTLRSYEEVADAIKQMVVRGAPAIGVAAAMGVALGARDTQTDDPAQLRDNLDRATAALAQVVYLLERDSARPPLANATSASVPQLFDRLDAALMARDGCGMPDSDLTKAIANLSRSIPGLTNHGADLPDAGQGLAGLHHLRIAFAELVACNLQMLAETA